MKNQWLSCALIAPVLLMIAGTVPAQTATTTHHVSGRRPVIGSTEEMAAERPVVPGHPRTADFGSPNANAWKLLATIPGTVIHDISFPTRKIGYAAAEQGQVWKTIDGGVTWTSVMNIGLPYYWYGVQALSADDVVISGFNNSNFQGIIRWSHDGGVNWTPDIVLNPDGWSFRVRFAQDGLNGLVMDGLNLVGQHPNAAHYTTDGGAADSDWASVFPDLDGGWFGNQFSLLGNLHARASGITYCASGNGGATWKCRPSIDPVFDGATFFVNDKIGWVGGGEISPSVEGWVHRTADGGKTWSDRTLDSPWPIREMRFVTPSYGWAAGGNVYSGVGGMYFSRDSGQTWSLDINTGAEMSACDFKHPDTRFQIWCAGYDSSFNSVIYSLQGKLLR